MIEFMILFNLIFGVSRRSAPIEINLI